MSAEERAECKRLWADVARVGPTHRLLRLAHLNGCHPRPVNGYWSAQAAGARARSSGRARRITSLTGESPRLLLAVLLRRLDQLLQRRVHDLLARSARPLVADDPLVVD